MALDSIKIWADYEIITAEDLNSIGEGVSNEVGTGNILPSSIVWPLVALGDIDMNGYSILNTSQVFGEYHVNEDQTLITALTAAKAAGGGVIVIDPGVTATASDLTLDVNNISIVARTNDAVINVPDSITGFGIRITANNCRINGVRFTGGAASKPCVLLSGCVRADVSGNMFDGITDGYSLQVGDGNTARSCTVTDNNFTNSSSVSVYALRFIALTLANNNFADNIGNDVQLGGDEGTANASYLNMQGNTFDGGNGYALYGSYTGVLSSNFAFHTIAGNIFESDASGVYLEGYLRTTFSGNQVTDNFTEKLLYGIITGNNFNSTATIDGEQTMLNGNFFSGVATLGANLSDCLMTGNWFASAVSFPDTDCCSVCVGNQFANNASFAGTNVPDVYGLNRGL